MTCEICGRECATCGHRDVVAWQLECYRIGYGREKARAEKAEALLAQPSIQIGDNVHSKNSTTFTTWNTCRRCGGPKLDSQIYCGAACSQLAEMGK